MAVDVRDDRGPRRRRSRCASRRARRGSSSEHIRGRSVPEARTVLAFTPRAAAREIEKVLQLGRRERGGEPRPDRRRPGRRRRLRGRGPDVQALARPRARPRGPHPQADLPHHAQARRRPRRRRAAQRPRPRRGEAEARAAPQGGAAEGRETGRRAEGRSRGQAASGPAPRSTRREEEGGAGANGPEEFIPAGCASASSTTGSPTGTRATRSSRPRCSRTSRSASTSTASSSHAGLSDILIRKDKQRITIDIYTARPGIVIGKSGAEVDALRNEIHAHDAARTSTSTSTRSSGPSSTRSSSRSRSPSSSRTASASGAR